MRRIDVRVVSRLWSGLSRCAVPSSHARWASTDAGAGSSSAAAAEALKAPEVSSMINDWNESFGEARELIKDALDSVGTTYFSEDMEDATQQTQDALRRWENLKRHLANKGETAAVERLVKEHELKMKQLAEELESAQHAGGD